MAHNIPTWLLASGLMALGMAWYQAIFTIFLANLIVLIPMLLNSHAGTKYGIPYPVFARASFGRLRRQPAGAAAGLRGLRLVRHPDLDRRHGDLRARRHDARPGDSWLDQRGDDRDRLRRRAAVDDVAELRGLLGPQHPDHRPRGMEAVRRFENWAAPFVLIVAFLLLWSGWSSRPAGSARSWRSTARSAGAATSGSALPAGADGHDRVLVDAVAEHAGLHPVRAEPARAGHRPGHRPADDHDALPAGRASSPRRRRSSCTARRSGTRSP